MKAVELIASIVDITEARMMLHDALLPLTDLWVEFEKERYDDALGSEQAAQFMEAIGKAMEILSTVEAEFKERCEQLEKVADRTIWHNERFVDMEIKASEEARKSKQQEQGDTVIKEAPHKR